MDDEAGGLFNIALSDSENEQKDESATEKRARRTGQSQAEYQAVKDTYRAKIEKGEVRPKKGPWILTHFILPIVLLRDHFFEFDDEPKSSAIADTNAAVTL